jgi:hypothetical protein
LLDEDSSLIAIGATAFAKCTSLRSFCIPRLAAAIGSNCFKHCLHLYLLKFKSSESLKKVVGDRSLDDELNELGVNANSSLFKIEVEDKGMALKFSG